MKDDDIGAEIFFFFKGLYQLIAQEGYREISLKIYEY